MTSTAPVTYHTVPAGTTPATCRGPRCGQICYWIPHPHGRTNRKFLVDCNYDQHCRPPTSTQDGVGVSHHITCADAGFFRGSRKGPGGS